jgi:uncharacterized membrane protein (UPF0127 family)
VLYSEIAGSYCDTHFVLLGYDVQIARVLNATRGTVLAERAELARSFATRGRGLMGRAGLAAGEGLVIDPEWSIHMFFMRFPIDAVFVAPNGTVSGLSADLRPWTPFAGVAPWRGRYVVELPAGVIAATGTQLGDRIVIEDQ